MATEESVGYYQPLQASTRPRTYLCGDAPDVPTERWYFEAVEDGGELIAIRQLVIEGDGTRHAYSADHIEDDWGFLTDQSLNGSEALSACSPEDFHVAWSGARGRRSSQALISTVSSMTGRRPPLMGG